MALAYTFFAHVKLGATQDIAAIAIPGGAHDAGKVHPQQLLDS